MTEKLEIELKAIASAILEAKEIKNINSLYDKSKSLYEKMVVLKFVQDKMQNVDLDLSKSDLASRFEILAGAVLNESTNIPESNPHEEDIMTPGIDTIRDMVNFMPNIEDSLDSTFADYGKEVSFVKKEETVVMESVQVKSLNDQLSKKIEIGLNDRIGFVNHLFKGNTEDFNRVLSQLNTLDSEKDTLKFINDFVKVDYNNWLGKEDYEERFIALVTRRFS